MFVSRCEPPVPSLGRVVGYAEIGPSQSIFLRLNHRSSPRNGASQRIFLGRGLRGKLT